jgi:hypothetical protein
MTTEVVGSEIRPSQALPHGFPYRDIVGSDIRLLAIQPGCPETSIECELYQVPLDSSPKYIALSYVWGDTANPKHIRVNAQPFQVTKTL